MQVKSCFLPMKTILVRKYIQLSFKSHYGTVPNPQFGKPEQSPVFWSIHCFFISPKVSLLCFLFFL